MSSHFPFVDVSITVIISVMLTCFPTRCLSSVDISFALTISLILACFVQIPLLIAYVILLCMLHFNNMVCNPLYKFRNLLGQTAIGIHAFTIYGIPVADFVITFLVAYLLSYLLDINLPITFVGLYVLGQIFHYIFGVNTRFFNQMGIRFEEEKEKKND